MEEGSERFEVVLVLSEGLPVFVARLIGAWGFVVWELFENVVEGWEYFLSCRCLGFVWVGGVARSGGGIWVVDVEGGNSRCVLGVIGIGGGSGELGRGSSDLADFQKAFYGIGYLGGCAFGVLWWLWVRVVGGMELLPLPCMVCVQSLGDELVVIGGGVRGIGWWF